MGDKVRSLMKEKPAKPPQFPNLADPKKAMPAFAAKNSCFKTGGASEKFGNQPCPLFRPRSILLCQQKKSPIHLVR